MDLGKICEVVSTELGIGEVREAGLAKIDIEKVREAASAYYEDLKDDEKQAAQKFFEAMDMDNSKNISIDEFRNFLSHAKIQTDDWLFKELDKDKNNTLYFQELVTFFYILSHDEYKHLLNYRAITDITELGIGEVREAGLAKIDIEKVREAVSAYYDDLIDDEKQAARKFFEDIDTENSNNISIDEFRSFLSHAKIQTDDWLFKELDKDKNNTLDSQELLTFFHILSHNEYKHLLNYRAITDITGRKEESKHSKIDSRKVAGANGQGRKWDMGLLSGLYGKLKRAYKVVEGENECSIV